MSKPAEIYLDMDGVCVNFMGAAITANGLNAETTLATWRKEYPGSLFPEDLLGKPAMDFFTHEKINDSAFWRDLIPYSWYSHLYEELSRLGHVTFLTAPTGAPGCVAGKLEWLTAEFGSGFADFIFTRQKNRLAHANAYLIDDMPYYAEPFEQRDGSVVLFPQIWNALHHIEDPVPQVIPELERLIVERNSS